MDDCLRKLRREESLGAVWFGAFIFVRTPEEDQAGGCRVTGVVAEKQQTVLPPNIPPGGAR
jgi:hypothetical protein